MCCDAPPVPGAWVPNGGKKRCQAKALPNLDFRILRRRQKERKHKVPPQSAVAEAGAMVVGGRCAWSERIHYVHGGRGPAGALRAAI